MKKKVLTILLLIALFIVTGCSGKETVIYQYKTRDYYTFSEEAYLGVQALVEVDVHGNYNRYIVDDLHELTTVIYYNFLNGEDSTMFVMRDNYLEINHLYLTLYSIMPEIFTFYYYEEAGYGQIKLIVTDIFDTEELALVADEILAGIAVDATDREKVKYIHDYLVRSSEYDMHAYRNVNNEELYNAASHAYSIIVNKKGMCAGYSRAMNYLLDRLNIPSLMVSSEADNHAWNLVYLEDQWYQIDATWDDPIPDQKGVVTYTYYLKPTSSGMFSGHKYDVLNTQTLDLNAYLEWGNWLSGVAE